MSKSLSLQEQIDLLGPWHYCHVFEGGVSTGDSTTEMVHPKLVELLAAGAFKRRAYPFVLDLGANSGLISMWFADNRYSLVTAIEGNQRYFDQLCFAVETKGYGTKIFPWFQDLHYPSLQPKNYDLVLCLGLLHHIREAHRVELLSECLAALRPAGEIVVQTMAELPIAEMLREIGFLNVEKLPTHWDDRAAWQAIKDPMKI